MLGARACIGFDAVSQAYTVAIAWQGTTSTFSPASWPTANNPAIARNCALNLYGTDTQRRVVWTTIMIGTLT
jgi:type IV pilus assembly protein PilV